MATVHNKSNGNIHGIGHVINGSNNKIRGNSNVINGSNNKIFGKNHVVNGSNNIITGDNCKVEGSNNTVDGDNCTVTGANNTVKGAACIVKGTNNTWNGNKVADTASSVVFDRTSYGPPSWVNFGVMNNTNGEGLPDEFFNRLGRARFHWNVIFDNNNNNNNNQNRTRDRDPAPPRIKDTIYPDVWKEEPEEAPDGKEKCVICLTRGVCVIALPCAHISICVKCCLETKRPKAECAICRKKVEKYQRAFVNGAE